MRDFSNKSYENRLLIQNVDIEKKNILPGMSVDVIFWQQVILKQLGLYSYGLYFNVSWTIKFNEGQLLPVGCLHTALGSLEYDIYIARE